MVLTGVSGRATVQNTPSNCRSLPYRLGIGQLLAFAMAMVLGASVGRGQPVPDTILLPDSLGPLRPGYHVAFGSSTNNIYVASESSDIIVVDGKTFQRIKRIKTGTPVGCALLVAQHNRLYCAYPSQGRIGVVDCTTMDTVGSIQVSTRPKLLCYSSGSDKLYCCDSVYGKVSAIDCAADTVRTVILTTYSPNDMVYDSTANTMFIETQHSLLTISCVTDSIISDLSGEYWSGLCLNKRRQELYVPGRVYPETIYVVSTQSDSVKAKIPTRFGLQMLLACNEATDLLYGAVFGGDGVEEYDCVGDTHTREIDLGDYQCNAIACDNARNLLFFRSACDLLVLDCATFGVVVDIGIPGYISNSDLLRLDPARYRAMMCIPSAAGALVVCDYKSDTPYVRGFVPLCGWWNSMCHNPATRRLYCGLGGCVSAVVDEQTNRVVKWANEGKRDTSLFN